MVKTRQRQWWNLHNLTIVRSLLFLIITEIKDHQLVSTSSVFFLVKKFSLVTGISSFTFE